MKALLLILPALAVFSTGCMTYRHKNEIVNETALRSVVPDGGNKYRLVEFRYRCDLVESDGKEQVVNGKAFTDWLAAEHPQVFSTSSNAVPLIVRETMTTQPEYKQKGDLMFANRIRPNVFDTIFVQITLGLWPATISCDYKFETEIQLSDSEFSTPFVWNTKYTDNVANSLVAKLYYPSSKGWESGSSSATMKRYQDYNNLKRTSISRKSSEDEKQAAKTELIWQWGYQNSPEVMKRGAALGIIGALAQLTPDQRKSVENNPIARYLAEKADGKVAEQKAEKAGE